MEALSGGYRPPEKGVRLLLSDHALRYNPPSPTVHSEIHALSKFRASRKGRIRVNKEVLAILKQVSAELDGAQRHYLAYKQYGEAGESILKVSPDLVALPGDPSTSALTAPASEAAPTDGHGCEEQHAAETEGHDTGHKFRRWGYFPLLSQLRAVSAKPKKPPPKQQQVFLDISAAVEHPDTVLPAADDCVDVPDSPKASWMQLVKQKKQEKEDSIAHMIRVRHAVLVIQRAWRAHLKKRASRALAMMMLRAKVRRAHRAAYVSVLLRRKTQGQQGRDGAQTAAAADDDDVDLGEEQLLTGEDEVQLTPQEESELSEALQRVLEEGSLSMADVAELQLTDLVQKMKAPQSKRPDSSSSSSSEEEEEEPEKEGSGWKVLSKPHAPVKRGLAIRIDAEAPSGSSWQGSLRTPGTARTPGGTYISHKLGSPDLLDDNSSNSSPNSMSGRHSGGGRQMFSGGRSVSIRVSGGDLSPTTPSLGVMAGQAGCLGSPKENQLARGKSGGVRVGRGVSVVLATADNAVAVAHGDGVVSIRARSAARSAHRSRAASRLNPAVAAGAADGEGQTAVAGDVVNDAQLCAGSRQATPTTGSRLGAPASRSSALPSPTVGMTAGHSAGNEGLADAGPRQGDVVARSLSVVSSMLDSSADKGSAVHKVPLAPDARPLSRQEFQRLLQASPMTPEVAQGIAAAAETAAAAAAVAAAEAATASGAEPGTPEWHDKQQQFHAEYQQQLQQQFEQEYHRQYQDAQYVRYQQQCAELQKLLQALVSAVGGTAAVGEAINGQILVMQSGLQSAAAGTLAAGLTAGSRSNNRSPDSYITTCIDGSSCEEYGESGGHQSTVSTDGSASAAPHNTVPVPTRPTRSQGTDRRSSTGNAGVSCQDPVLQHSSHPGTAASSNSASRRTTRGDSRGFCSTSAPGATFSKYERGLSDGLQQDYRVLAADSVLAAGRGSSPVPHQSRRSERGARRSCEGSLQTNGDNSLQQHSSNVQNIAGASSLPPQPKQQQQQQQQQQNMKRSKAVSEPQLLLEGSGGFSCYGSSGTTDGAAASLADSSNNNSQEYLCRHAEAVAAVAAAAGLYQERSTAAAAAASGRAAGAMQGLVLGPTGVWQQQQSRADGWFERLKARHNPARQPWDIAAGGNSRNDGLGLGHAPEGSMEGSAADLMNEDSTRLPIGKWSKRTSVHDAWLYIDGKAASALPWQALAAAATAAGTDKASPGGNDDSAAAVIAAAEGFMRAGQGVAGSHLSGLSVTGKRLLVRMMWLKSAAGVLRGLGRDAGVLERKVVQLLKDQAGPVGAELLLWSIADHKQQQQQQLWLQQQQQWQAQQAVRSQGCDVLLDLQQQGRGYYKALVSPQPAAAARQQYVALDSQLLGQNLPLLPAARSRALMSKPVTQGALPQQQQQQQQLLLLAQLQQLQHLQHLPQAGGLLQSQQGGMQEQAAPQQLLQWQQLCRVQLEQQQVSQQQQQLQLLEQESEGLATIPQQVMLAQRVKLAKRSRHTHSCTGAAAGAAADAYVAHRPEQTDISEMPMATEGSHNGCTHARYKPGARDDNALTLYGQKSVLIQHLVPPQAADSVAGDRRRATQQQQQRQLDSVDSNLPIPVDAALQLLAAVPEQGPAQHQLQGHLLAQTQTGVQRQQQLKAQACMIPIGSSAVQRNTDSHSSDVCGRTAARAQLVDSCALQGKYQPVAAVAFNSMVAAAARGSRETADPACGPMYVSFVTSNRYQQQLKAQRTQPDGSLRPTRSADDFELQQLHQAATAGCTLRQKGVNWGPQAIRGMPVVSPLAAGPATAAVAGVVSDAAAATIDYDNHPAGATLPPLCAASSSNLHQAVRQEQPQQQQMRQQQPRPKRILRANAVGVLPALPGNSLDGLSLLPASSQAKMKQQQSPINVTLLSVQQLQQSPPEDPLLDLLLCHHHQQQQQVVHHRLDHGNNSVSAVCSVDGAAVKPAYVAAALQGAHQSQAGGRTCSVSPPRSHKACDKVRTGAGSTIPVEGPGSVQCIGQQCVLGCTQKNGHPMLTVAQPQLPQLVALRVQTQTNG